jgi:phage terminase small subunit
MAFKKFPGAKLRVQPRQPVAHPPVTLSPDAQTWWRQLCDEHDITDAGGILLLNTTLEAWDRMKEAQGVLAREGLTLPDRFGHLKPHPCSVIERDARSAVYAGMRALALDLEPIKPLGRPPAS